MHTESIWIFCSPGTYTTSKGMFSKVCFQRDVFNFWYQFTIWCKFYLFILIFFLFFRLFLLSESWWKCKLDNASPQLLFCGKNLPRRYFPYNWNLVNFKFRINWSILYVFIMCTPYSLLFSPLQQSRSVYVDCPPGLVLGDRTVKQTKRLYWFMNKVLCVLPAIIFKVQNAQRIKNVFWLILVIICKRKKKVHNENDQYCWTS